ncbi:hypothetical protein ABZ912_48035 [Nonomuraea angiospora]|uniref:hypothetical protein n=1 Tax=Nonomuraea angiospora TaxID=46172 RepID=UPI0033C30C72
MTVDWHGAGSMKSVDGAAASADDLPRTPSPLRSYEWWQLRLAEEFFSANRSGTPVLFFIDATELQKLQGQEDVSDLGAAVSAVLDWHKNPYGPIMDRVQRWQHSERQNPPPCLPLLAASVLAAANMKRTVQGPGAPAYYARLAEVLKPSWNMAYDHKQLLQRYYDDVVELWILLDAWLRGCGGHRGLSTIKKSETLTKIGYAQSQALIRVSDHAALTRFFREALSAGQPVDGARLLRDLKVWSHNQQGLSRRLRDALASEADNALLEPLLTALAEGWDGAVTLPLIDGLRQMPLLVALEDDFVSGWRLGWHTPVVPGVEQDALKHPAGTFAVAAAAGEQAYSLSGAVPDPATALTVGMVARGHRLIARVIGGRHVIALSEDPVAGAWVERDNVVPFEPYVFLFDPSGEPQVRRFLQEVGLRWYQPEATSSPGWCVARDLEFADDARLAAAVAGAGIRGIDHIPARRPSLRGGLRVAPDMRHRHHYLRGGEPDVVIPESLRKAGRVLLNGEPIAVPADGVIQLRGRGLADKQHSVEVDGASISFQLHPVASPQARNISPTRTPSGSPESVVVPLVGDARFLTARGRFIKISKPSEPPWWEDRAQVLRSGAMITVPVPAEAVWLVAFPEGRDPAITLIRNEEPDIGVLSQQAKDFWSRLVLMDLPGASHSRLWRRYRQAVLSHFPREVFGRV